MNTNKEKKILVTGGDGMVASQVDFGVKLGKKELNILDKKSIDSAIKKYQPEVILHLAAMTDMLACQENPKEARKVNVVGTKNIAEACKKNKVNMVYLSTCVVFDGKKKTPYGEYDKPHPLNVYGKTKWQGEIIAKKVLPNVLIIRTGWLFGGGLKNDKKFVCIVFKKLKNGEDIRATDNRYGSPTYIKDLLDTIKKLIKKDAKGIFHVVNKGIASYFEVAKEIKKVTRFKTKVIPVKSFNIENPKLKRAVMEALDSSKIKLRPWKIALKRYLEILTS